jgi:hypothetical protein
MPAAAGKGLAAPAMAAALGSAARPTRASKFITPTHATRVHCQAGMVRLSATVMGITDSFAMVFGTEEIFTLLLYPAGLRNN